MGRFLGTVLLALCAGPSFASSAEPTCGAPVDFAAYRNGQHIGSHRVSFERQGDRLLVTTSIELALKFIGITVYRYKHRSQEEWWGGDLRSFSSSTDDDGKSYEVRVVRDRAQLKVERLAPGAAAYAGDVIPADVLPSTHWNLRQAAQTSLLNAQKGTLERIAVTPLGRTNVKISSGWRAATHYR